MKNDPPRTPRFHRALLATALATALGAVALPAVDARAGQDRDGARAASLRHLDRALRAHHETTGELPAHRPDPLVGGWESSRGGHFLAGLVTSGHLEAELLDPLNDDEHHLLYHRYPAGTEGHPEPFYVLAVSALEGAAPPRDTAAVRGDRDWGQEYPLVLIGP